MSDATNTRPEEAAAAAAAAPVDTKAGEAAPATAAAPSTAAAPAEKQDEAAASAQEESVPPRRRLDDAERLMALKQWEQAADEYAQALDGLREEFPDEHSPQLAPVLHRYGRSLLEHAIATSGALGGGGGQQDAPMPVKKKKSKAASGEAGPSSSSSAPAKPADPRFSFSGDADDDEEDEEEDEAAGQAGEEEDEDDLSVAFAVLDLARIIYQKLLDSDSTSSSSSASLTTIQGQSWNHVRIKNELAEVLNDLGDVGLETENFQQASSDYETSLQLLSPLLHPHSRRLADAYLRLGLALEFHPEDKRQAEAPNYVQSAANTLRARLDALKRRREILQRGGSEEARSQAAAAQLREEKAMEESAAEAGEGESEGSSKGKGKQATSEEGVPAERDDVAEMDEPRVERELKDVEEMIADLDAKLEDSANNNAAAAAANGGSSSSAGGAALPDAAKQALQQAINEAFLGASTNSLAQPRAPADGPVNDLSGMVRKKKRPAADGEEATGKGKGKEGAAAVAPAGQAEGSGSGSKKARVEDEAVDA